jgi:streptomycin 6-kinase
MEDGLVLVPVALRASHAKYFGNATAAWIQSLPDLVDRWRHEWQLQLDGAPQSGAVALVVPVVRADGTPAVLKLQPVDEETRGEPIALACWAGNGAVRLLERDLASGSMLLERLDVTRSLVSMPEPRAISVIAGLLRRLNRLPAPPSMRPLDEIARRIVADAPAIVARATDADEQRLLMTCAARLADLLTEPVARRLLHWDLHYENVLARLGNRDDWAAIDPKPLAGDPGFELLPALWNRWAELTASGDIRRALLRRFDLMIEVQGLDAERAAAWTLARVLQNALWDLGRLGQTRLNPAHRGVAEGLLSRYQG